MHVYDGMLAPGVHTLTLSGDELSTGLYLARAVGEQAVSTQRLVRLR